MLLYPKRKGIFPPAQVDPASIITQMLRDGSITTAKIDNLAVTNAKIADLAFTNAKIDNLAVTNAKIADAAITNAKINDLDAVKITAGYLNVNRLEAGTISATKLSFSAFDKGVDDLDDVAEGTTYNRVLTTDISAGHILLSEVVQSANYRTSSDTEKATWNDKEIGVHRGTTAPTDTTKLWVDTSVTPNVWKRYTGTTWVKMTPTEMSEIGISSLDDIPNGTYSKVLTTDISAGHIKLSSVEQTASYRTTSDTEKGTWNGKPDDMDEIGEGSTYQRVRATEISAGYLKLTSNTVKSGEWYDESGVEIDATHGINIYGTDNALTTRATKTGTIQCSVNSSGQITAGAGAVILDADGIKINGEYLFFQSGGVTAGSIYATSSTYLNVACPGGTLDIAGTTTVVKLRGSDIQLYQKLTTQGAYAANTLYDILPYNTTTWLGNSSSRWARLYGAPILATSADAVEGAVTCAGGGSGNIYIYSDGAWRTNA